MVSLSLLERRLIMVKIYTTVWHSMIMGKADDFPKAQPSTWLEMHPPPLNVEMAVNCG